MHLQPIFARYEYVGSGIAAGLFANGLCLPSGSNLTSDDLNRVVAVIKALHEDGREVSAELCIAK